MFNITNPRARPLWSYHPASRLLTVVILISAAPPFASTLSAQSGGAALPAGPAYNLTAEQWRTDLKFMSEEMQRRHKNLYHTVAPEKFATAVADA